MAVKYQDSENVYHAPEIFIGSLDSDDKAWTQELKASCAGEDLGYMKLKVDTAAVVIMLPVKSPSEKGHSSQNVDVPLVSRSSCEKLILGLCSEHRLTGSTDLSFFYHNLLFDFPETVCFWLS